LTGARCLIPLGEAAVRSPVLVTLLASVQAAGTYAVLLLMLGAATRVGWPTGRWLAPGLYAVGVVLAEATTRSAVLPTVVALVLLVASLGLMQLSRAVNGRLLHHIAAALFAGILPLSVMVRTAQAPKPPADDPPGWLELSVDDLTAVVARVPEGAGLVEEDALADLLLRAGVGRGQSSPRVVRIASVTAGRAGRPLFALPRAQRWLQHRGFALQNVEGVAGLAAAEQRGACRPLQAGWRRVADLESAETFAFVAASPESIGPIRLYAFFDVEPKLYSLDWPTDAIPGFRWKTYAPADPALQADLQADAVPLGDVVVDRSYALRLDQQRTAHGPLALVTTFHAQPTAVFGRLSGTAVESGISVCPAYPHDALGITRQP
jgi:hypothetical protein